MSEEPVSEEPVSEEPVSEEPVAEEPVSEEPTTDEPTIREDGGGPAGSSPPSEPPRCSAKDCRADATTDLGWRNPRLHDAARVKHWLACDAHADHLADFLSRRGFLLARSPLPPAPQ